MYELAIREVKFSDKLKQNKQLKKMKTKSNEINEKLSTSKFDVLPVDAWKVKTYYKIKDNPKGCIFMGDINNLSQTNKNHKNDIETVDGYIINMISKIKQVFINNNVQNFDIGKMGDEIYIYSSELSQETEEKILEELNDVEESTLSISFGSSNKLENGLEEGVKQAEAKMYENKLKKKKEIFAQMYGIEKSKDTSEKTEKKIENVIENLVEAIIQEVLNKMRIDVEELQTYRQKLKLKQNFKKDLEIFSRTDEIVKREISKDIDISKKTEVQEDKIYKRIKQYEDDFISKFEIKITEEDIREYVLSQVLINHSIDGVEDKEYYDKIGYKEQVKRTNLMMMRDIKSTQLISIDFSGIKYINDIHGHDECDEEVEKVIKKIENLLESMDVNKKGNVIADGISKYFIFIDKTEKKITEDIAEQIKNIDTKLIANCNVQDLYNKPEKRNDRKFKSFIINREKENSVPEKVYKTYYTKSVNNAEKSLKSIKLENKLDSNILESYIKENLVRILTNKDFKEYVKIKIKDGQTQGEIIEEIIDKSLEKILKISDETDNENVKENEKKIKELEK